MDLDDIPQTERGGPRDSLPSHRVEENEEEVEVKFYCYQEEQEVHYRDHMVSQEKWCGMAEDGQHDNKGRIKASIKKQVDKLTMNDQFFTFDCCTHSCRLTHPCCCRPRSRRFKFECWVPQAGSAAWSTSSPHAPSPLYMGRRSLECFSGFETAAKGPPPPRSSVPLLSGRKREGGEGGLSRMQPRARRGLFLATSCSG